MDQFLANVEGRAFQITRFATGCDHDALDLVQDSMISLVSNYADKPETAWKPLFYKILHNRIADFQRKKTLTGRIFSWIGLHNPEDEKGVELLDKIPDPAAEIPELVLSQNRFSEALIMAIEQLPPRQQLTFLLRIWEGMSVKETAEIMQCSEGSIKTHLSRATQSLRNQLEPHNFLDEDHE
ncbi:MAG: RNA polymerase sigma factor [Neptuniibacter caesariensis]|uniref:RNA polymerase sigma factor n=1 Tax=Neptuniibacter caesariensis TaxID=207954 RepID=A0A2G6JQ68_NEPCE|nr:MAG: RNA polymerase sigma factor [Neptuniibacter caesariensis]